MALGGGTFRTQNKILPGAYINYVSVSRAKSLLGQKGTVAIGLELDWGEEEKVFKVEYDDFRSCCLNVFGYTYENPKMKGLRDLFLNANTVYFYKLNKGVKASNKFATARCGGIRGNDLKTVIQANIDNLGKFDVYTLFDNKKVDAQTVSKMEELENNDYVVWNKQTALEATAGTSFTGGTNGEKVTGAEYQTFLDSIESYDFNILACLSTAKEIQNTFIAFIKRMREDIGLKCQLVLYRQNEANHEGVISIENKVLDDELESSLVYWVAGAEAGCAVNKTCSNKVYDGEFEVDINYNQIKLKEALLSGKFIFHLDAGEVKVLDDINTLTKFTEEKNKDFSSNQTLRVLDQIAKDIAKLFNFKYNGHVENEKSGRVSFWNDIVDHHKELEKLKAIENFKVDDVVVEKGETKKSVVVTDSVEVVNAMSKLYMTVYVS